jgi:hypothetical protein
MAEKPEHKKWEDRINAAIKVKNDWWEQFKVDLALDYFEGNQNPGYTDEEWITINKFYSHMMAQLPALYSIDPYFYVKLKKTYKPEPGLVPGYEERARIRQAMLNYLKGELELKTKARLSIQDAFFSIGVAKTRFSADAVENPQAGKPIMDEDGKPLKDEETGKPLMQPDELPVNKHFIISRLHPSAIFWDVDASTLPDTWSMIGEVIQMSREDALKDRRFKRSIIQSMPGRTTEPQEKTKKRWFNLNQYNLQKEQKKDTDLLIFYEVYDLKNRQMLMIGEGADNFVIKPRGLPPGIENHPYSILRFVLRDKSPYPIPPMSQGIDQQKEYNLSRSRIVTHRKRFNRKYTVIQSMLDDPSAISKLETGEDGTCIIVQAHGAVEPIRDAPLDQQTYTELAMLNNDMVEIFGNPDTARGIASADSATEASIMDSRLEIREGDRQSIVVDFILDIAKKLDQLIEANLDEDQAIKVTGPQGNEWVKVMANDYEKIEGEFEYSVNLGSTRPRLPDIERAQLTAFLSQVIIPMPHILQAPSLMKKIAEMYHIEDEAILKELQQLGQMIMSGQQPMPGQSGTPANNPISQIIGMATGQQGGNVNGGGAPGGMSSGESS